MDAPARRGRVAYARYVALDQVIAANADRLFPGMVIMSASLFRVCRDAEVEFDEDDNRVSKRALVEREILQRRFEPVVRLEVQPNADPAMVAELMQRFALTSEDVYEISALLDYTTLFEIAGLEIDELRYPPLDASSTGRARGGQTPTSSLPSEPATSSSTTRTTASTPAWNGSSGRRPTTP